MTRCFVCDALGIHTVANSVQPIVVDEKAYPVCVDCRSLHLRALELNARTMFDRLFPPAMRKVKARADTKPRITQKRQAEIVEQSVVLVTMVFHEGE